MGVSQDLTLVVFDIDGTLVDSRGMILDGFTRAFAAIGRERPAPARLLAQVGLSLPEVMARLLPEADAETRARAACRRPMPRPAPAPPGLIALTRSG